MSVGSQRASDRASAELVELGCSTCDGQTTAGTRTARGATGEPGAAPRHGKALSEDLDLIALAPRRDVAAALDKLLPRGASRATGVLRWNPSLTVVKEADAASLEGPHGIRLRVQLLRDEGYAPWPTEQRSLHQRYADAPPATLSVPTRAAFAAWKTATWADRRAPRDLWDLQALAHIGQRARVEREYAVEVSPDLLAPDRPRQLPRAGKSGSS